MNRQYTVILHKDNGWWVANVPTLHATAQGRSRSVALKRAKSLIRFALDTIQDEGAKPPVEDRSSLEVIRVPDRRLNLPAVSKSRFVRALHKLSFTLEHQKGSHQKWRHPDGRFVYVYMHSCEDIRPTNRDRLTSLFLVDGQTGEGRGN